MASYKNIVILTGAGLSAESGISTFRDADGAWAKVDFEDVATPEGFARDPGLVHEFSNARRKGLAGVKPNAAHFALARLEKEYSTSATDTSVSGASVMVVTQNVDNLHEAAGSKSLIHMHGELMKALCNGCGSRVQWGDDLSINTPCPGCGERGGMRPDVVWFGEMPYHMERIEEALSRADLFVSIGTSGNVYPAAGFVEAAADAGAHTVELNLEPSEGARFFDEAIHGPATKIVPDFVDKLCRD